ncbi:MAG: GGDEF domain-containing protein [Myxococcaceae bacterium]|nr:GGDEF domain-containing protein [Myxococcaceae bacterium]MCI0673036.1 GGDEF domain-containing protein [Myxococcaceae bacterium]
MVGDATRLTSKKLPAVVRPGRPGGDEAWLVQIRGPQLGRKFVLDAPEQVIGRGERCDIVVGLDNVSREHAELALREGRVFVRDAGSTNGTVVNGVELQGERELNSGDHLQVGGAIFKFLSGDDIEKDYHDTIYRLAIEDGLTQVHNKRYLLEFLEREMGRAHRYSRPLSLMLLDVDHFKRINDTRGHLAGDHVLRELARLIKPTVRRDECFARYGGEEFAVVMPECGPDNARRFAEKVRALVEEARFVFEEEPVPVTVSVGVADLAPEMSEPALFLQAADVNLYRAKQEGRNRVVG